MNLAFMAGLFSAWHHHATALHGFCSDHGARIHLDHRHGDLGEGADGANLRAHHHVAGSHGCFVLAFLGQSALRREAPSPLSGRQDPAPLMAPWQGQPPGQIPPLRQSPKQSPPLG